MATSYIPAKDADFSAWLQNFSTLLTATPTLYGLVSADAVIVAGQNTAFQAAYTLATDPSTRTSPTVADKTAARNTAEVTVRPYAIQIALNAGVSDMDKVAIGVTVAKTIPTPVPPPTTTPTLSLVAGTSRTHQLAYRDSATPTSKGKPAGSTGIQIFRAIGVVPAIDPTQAVYYQNWTKSPNLSEFGTGDVGKICTYFARWMTTSGPAGTSQFGPWSTPLALTVM